MLIDFQYQKHSKKLVLSIVDKTGKLKLKYYDWSYPEKYQNCEFNDPNKEPIYKSWDGKPVKKVFAGTPDRYAVYEFLDSLPEKEKTEIFEYNDPDMYFIDIETGLDANGQYSKPIDADGPIQSISIVYGDKIILMGLKEMSADMQKRIIDDTNKYFDKFSDDYSLKYIKYKDEFSMLKSFFEDMMPRMTCISGWNFIDYDWTYLLNRARKLSKDINGKEVHIDVLCCSPTRRLNAVWMSVYELPAHKLIFDYMQLYEAFDTSIKVKESSSLDFVAGKLVGVSKIKYNGSLHKLYDDDFEKFMYYNAVDSILVKKIHESKKYISIVFAVSFLAKIKTLDVISPTKSALASLAITEGVLRDRYRSMENIVLFKNDDKEAISGEKLAGGWVMDPVTGMSRWVVIYDFASLYPTTQRQFFISPENFYGVQKSSKGVTKNDSLVTEDGKIIDLKLHVVCVNGCVFKKQSSPTLRMLEDVYADRKKAKKMMMTKKEEYQGILNEIKELQCQLN